MTADLHTDDRVFLYPKKPTAPTICYRQPQATVLAKPDGMSYVLVLVDGETEPRRLHCDNVVWHLPDATQSTAPAKPRKALPDGMEEAPLW